MESGINYEFDREGRIAGWESLSGSGVICASCANDEIAGNPLTMEEVGYEVLCAVCGQRIS
jgi:hypothetical protein